MTINNEELYYKIILEMENILLNKIETQVILQLLIDKNIVTKEEISEKRNYVSSQTKYKNILNESKNIKNKILSNYSYDKKFDNEFNNMLNGKEYDKDWIINELDKMK